MGASVPARGREVVRGARSVFEYDYRFISPLYGFRGCEEYTNFCTRSPTCQRSASYHGAGPATIRDPGRVLRDFQLSTIIQLLPVISEGGGHPRLPFASSDPSVVRLALEQFARTDLQPIC